MPSVSVCIPTYNRSAMLRKAISSVLSQTFSDFEIIVSDNASEDDTEMTVRSFDDTRILYSRNERNIGVIPNINKCFAMAKGEFIAFCPDDDWMLPDNLARKVEVLRQRPTVGMVHSRFHMVDGDGNLIRANTNRSHGPERPSDAFEPGQVFLRRMMEGYCEVNPVSALFRRECLTRLGGLDESLTHTDDYEYWMRLAVYYDVAYLAEPLVAWRCHSQSITSKFLVGGKTGATAEHVRDQLRSKYKVLKAHGNHIADVAQLRRKLRVQTGERITAQAEAMMEEGAAQGEVRRYLCRMALEFPCLVGMEVFWKSLLKTLLSRRRIEALKKARHSISH